MADNTMGFGGNDDAAEGRGLLGRAQEFAAGLKHPVPALFHVLFKARASCPGS